MASYSLLNIFRRLHLLASRSTLVRLVEKLWLAVGRRLVSLWLAFDVRFVSNRLKCG